MKHIKSEILQRYNKESDSWDVVIVSEMKKSTGEIIEEEEVQAHCMNPDIAELMAGVLRGDYVVKRNEED